MPPAPIVEPSSVDTSKILFDLEEIRRVNRQRYEMEQLTAIVHLDREANLIIGYKDVRHDEFWVRGHMPDYPLMPGVLMCEAAAQLCSFFSKYVKILEEGFVGFGGMEEVRFRGPVRPGDRLLIICKAARLHRRQTTFDSQGFVGSTMVYQGRIIGVPLLSSPSE